MGRVAIASGDLIEGTLYIVVGGDIDYDGGTITDGNTFVATEVDTFSTNSGTPEVFEHTELTHLTLEYEEPRDYWDRFPDETELIALEMAVYPVTQNRFPDTTELKGLSLELEHTAGNIIN